MSEGVKMKAKAARVAVVDKSFETRPEKQGRADECVSKKSKKTSKPPHTPITIASPRIQILNRWCAMIRPYFRECVDRVNDGSHIPSSLALIKSLMRISNPKARIIAMRRWVSVIRQSHQRQVDDSVDKSGVGPIVLNVEMSDSEIESVTGIILRYKHDQKSCAISKPLSPFERLKDVVESCDPINQLPSYEPETVCKVCRQSRFISLKFKQLRRPDEPTTVFYTCSNKNGHAKKVRWKL